MTLFYRIRVHGLENFPEDDGLLICSNHQSFLDPLILGVVCPRPVNYLGRKTLFKFRPLGWFLTWNDAIAIDREATGIGGMKDMLRRLKRGESVVMFPEGTRTQDGDFHTVMSGFCAVAKRSKSTLMPIGFDGAFQAYPRHRTFPRPGVIHVVMGKPILFEEYESLSDQETTDLLASRIRDCFDQACQHWQRAHRG
jgi:1-acyl-sn-glycerol-3-phosphate acyltransferase